MGGGGGSVPPCGADGTGGRRVSCTSHPAAGLWVVLFVKKVLSELSVCGAFGVSGWPIFLGESGRPVAVLVHCFYHCHSYHIFVICFCVGKYTQTE